MARLSWPRWFARNGQPAAGESAVRAAPAGRRLWKWVAGAALVVFLAFWAVGWYWSREPGIFWVVADTERGEPVVIGYSTVDTLVQVIGFLLEKPGGYLSNDVMPPSVFLDNMPNFEYGVLVQCRDLARVLRNDY